MERVTRGTKNSGMHPCAFVDEQDFGKTRQTLAKNYIALFLFFAEVV